MWELRSIVLILHVPYNKKKSLCGVEFSFNIADLINYHIREL